MNVRRAALLLVALALLVAPVGRAQYPSPVVVTDPYAESARIDTELASAQAALADADARYTRGKTELDALAPRQAHAREGMRTRVRALYRMQRAGHLPVAGGFDAMLTHLARVERLERIVERDARSVSYLDRRTQALREDVRAAETELTSLRTRVSGLEARKAALEAELGTNVGDAWLSALGTPAYPADPAAGLGHLGVAPLPAVTPLGSPGLVGTAPAPAPVSGFAVLRGRLGAPVARALEVRDGVRDDGPGLEFVTAPGTSVHSVADGRVAFAGAYGSYGKVVILDHGDSFYTVYGGLGAFGVRVGDSVSRGTRLGDVAPAQRPAVFFEVRRSTRTLDPRSWTGL